MKKPNFEAIKIQVSEAKDSAVEAIKQGAEAIADKASQTKQDYDLWRYKPVFMEDYNNPDYVLPKLIQIVEEDDRAEKDVCQGAFGFNDSTDEMKALTVLGNCTDMLGIEFYPTVIESVYYVDPVNPQRYIELNEYFSYTKAARILELKELAQALGATYFKITLKTEKKQFISNSAKAKIGAKKVGSIDVKTEVEKKTYETVSVEAENKFKGHGPFLPKLYYYKNDPVINSLIKMRMDENAHLTEETFMIKYSNVVGINTNNAVKIENALKKMGKETGNASISNEAEEEARLHFEYHIEFPKEQNA
ncbi:MAG: hypothetical protein IJH91_06565 [Mogibacterium sp.]|nr:hypothetical protein [Mogibacterium sp.]